MRLSDNFSLREFLRSGTAARHGIDMTPPPEVVENLQRLCRDVLQPLREYLGTAVMVTSGYRPPELNRLIGGSAKSQHMLGEAADIIAVGYRPIEVAESIRLLQLPYHQLIHEFGDWTHVSVAPFGQPARGQVLTATRRDGRIMYLAGLHA